jgi:putative restriction endonuclease
MSVKIKFGEIDGIEEGDWFEGRKEMMPAGFHRKWGSGIDGNGKEGTAAIVLSGGYEDDSDDGDIIIYTGAGGNDPNSGKQISDQTWTNPGNAGLIKSMDEGLPVRVIRGFKHKSHFSPKSGYSYAGLYNVIDAWQEIGKSGFKICRFKLVYAGSDIDRASVEEIETQQINAENLILDHGIREKKRTEGTVLRIVRDTQLAITVKVLYNHECQVCGTAIPTKSGFYAEGAHIKPLGKPHNGDDSLANLLCLCPNHHVMFDKGSISITEKLEIIGAENGNLFVHEKHFIDKDNISYHRKSHGF